MNSSAQPRSSPIHLLLRLEWVLLGVAAIVQVLVSIGNPQFGFPIFNLLGLIVFAAMRLSFPERWSYKLLYTIVEFGLVLILTFASDLPSPSLLYIVLTIRNCVLLAGQNTLEGRVRSTITFVAFIACILSQTYRFSSGRMLLSNAFNQIGSVWLGFAIVFGLVFLFLHLLVDAIVSERKGQEQLAAANTQLRQYALQVEELATERERNRIARDIHDSLGHSLTVFNIHIGAALRLLHRDPAEAEALLLEVKDLGSQALQEVRESVTLLRADLLQGRSLPAAIENLVRDFQRTTGILPTFTYGIAVPLAVELEFALYRLVQESLTNIRKHAAASQVEISISATATEIIAIVKDNGNGFDLGHQSSGFGLMGMQERTATFGGVTIVETAPDRGCQIQAIFPVDDRLWHKPQAGADR